MRAVCGSRMMVIGKLQLDFQRKILCPAIDIVPWSDGQNTLNTQEFILYLHRCSCWQPPKALAK